MKDILLSLLSTLQAIRWFAWVVHWKSAGDNAYSDHLLFQRIYSGDQGGPNIDDQIDGLGERMIALWGQDAVPAEEVTKRMADMVRQAEANPPVQGALLLEQTAVDLATKAIDLLEYEETPELRIGLDNFLRDLVDQRSVAVYLLQQRLRRGEEAKHNPDDDYEHIAKTAMEFLPILLLGGVAGKVVGTLVGAEDKSAFQALGVLSAGAWLLTNRA